MIPGTVAVQLLGAIESEPAVPDLAPALYLDTDTFFSPTVAAGSVDLAASLYAETDTFFTPVVVIGESLVPDLFTETDVFHSPTVVGGAVDLTPSLFSETDVFHAPAVLAESSWTQVASWTHSSNVSTIDFTGLSGSEFLVIGRGTTLTLAGSRRLRVSDDNGSTWFDTSGDYADISALGVESDHDGPSLHSGTSTAARDFAVHVFAANLSSPPKMTERRTRIDFGASILPGSVTPGVGTINALRLYATTGLYSGGTVRVYVRG